MSSTGKKWIRLSPFRQCIVELMHLARKVPLVTAERRMNLAPLVQARVDAAIRPTWTVIFSKAFALVAARRPELRRAYMSYPWPHLYQHPGSIASIIVERNVDGEQVPVQFRIRNPESMALIQLNEAVQRAKLGPVSEIKEFRRMKLLGNLPFPLRRLLWRMGYHWSGGKRAHYFGTFALSSPASAGAGLTTILSPVACTLHYGLFDEGRLDVWLTFDHRVLDGAPVGRALADLEETLLSDLLVEIEEIGARRQTNHGQLLHMRPRLAASVEASA
jgi:hypothetical protein